jgi:hypothetical protein
MQLSLDILNFTNMVNKNWGIRENTTVRNPLIVRGLNTNGTATFNLQELGGQLVTKPFQNVVSTASTWGMQLGLRYIFN